MRSDERFCILDLSGVAVIDIVANYDATNRDVCFQRPGDAYEHLRVEASELLMRFADNEACVSVPL